MSYNEMVLDMVDEILDEEGEVHIGNLSFRRSFILKELDPIAYREVVLDIVNSKIEDLEYDLDRLDPEVDADEIEDIKAQIAELEDI